MATNDSVMEYLVLKTQTSIASLLIVLPLSIVVLVLGWEQWKSKRSDPAWFLSFSDFFTFNQALMEVVGNTGYVATLVLILCGCGDSDTSFMLGSFSWYGQMFFPLFTCLEHYIAVVHPVIYVRLKTGRRCMIRNTLMLAVWVLTISLGTTVQGIGQYVRPLFIIDICFMSSCLGLVFYCSVAVLKVLVLPKPGGAVSDKERVDRSKRYAFFVIVFFLAVLSVRFSWNTMFSIMWSFPDVNIVKNEVIFCVTFWINILTSLMQPLLFLHRAGKLCQCARVRK